MMHKRALCQRGDKCRPLTFKARLNCAVTHHPELSSVEIADRAEIQHARLMAYACESHSNDHIPFKALLRLCAALNRWDLLECELEMYHRRIVTIDVATHGDALDEAVDVATKAARILADVRDMRKNGIDQSERVHVRNLLRELRLELDELDGAIEQPSLRSVSR